MAILSQEEVNNFKQRMKELAEKQRQKRKQTILKGENVSYELEFNDESYDTGYGEIGGDLIIEVEPIIEDCSFDAHNLAGNLQSYGGYGVTGVGFVSATFFGVGNNGQELGEYTFDSIEELKQFGIDEDTLIEMLQDRVDTDLI